MFTKSALMLVCAAMSTMFVSHGPVQEVASTTTQEATAPQEAGETSANSESVFGLATTNSRYAQLRKQERDISNAAKQLRTAKTGTEKKAAEDKLRKLLAADYDSRLNDYEKHLDNLAAQLKQMRTKLQKRRSAKSDMIDLRVKVLKAEADDLGWPSRINRSRFPSRGVTGGAGFSSGRTSDGFGR